MFARILLGGVVVCALAFVSFAEEPKETKLKPTLVFSGSHSAIRAERFELATTAKEWESLWAKHRGDAQEPLFTETSQMLSLDFETHYVIAIFTGSGEPCVFQPRQRGDIVAIGLEIEIFSTEGRLPSRTDHEKAKANATATYAFIVLPKPVKTVVIEENRETRRGQPPQWHERAKFPAPKNK
jgi:hypothetical protein